jgi:hypothetical protein
MSAGSDITVLYRESADALTEVLAENPVGPARRGRLARARAAVKHHPNIASRGIFVRSKLPLRIGKRCKRLGVSTRHHMLRAPRRDQGSPQQARELLPPIYGWFSEGFDTRDLR